MKTQQCTAKQTPTILLRFGHEFLELIAHLELDEHVWLLRVDHWFWINL